MINSIDINTLLNTMNIPSKIIDAGEYQVKSPIDGTNIGNIQLHSVAEIDEIISHSKSAFQYWRTVPAPKRGELIRIFGNILREHKEPLGKLVTIECGKIYQEGLGEVQEMIDICDFAVGLSRQLHGLTIASERPGHKMQESWLPLGPTGIISAFNFPVAVWAWNATLAIVCGNSIIWKPSEKTPITAIVCQYLFERACQQFSSSSITTGELPPHLSSLILGESKAGEQLVNNPNIPLISATGSCAMGKKVGPVVAARFGRSILELGGNNAIIVTPSADINLALRAIVFGAVGTAGQRCTSTRRLFVQKEIYNDMFPALTSAYNNISIGNPLDEANIVGPLIDQQAYKNMQEALRNAEENGGKVHGGKRVDTTDNNTESESYYVQPAIIEMPPSKQSIQTETFAPILYVYPYESLEEAIHLQNDVPQGLSSAIFTNDIREAELFTSSIGSDCGIANINIGTSGAEIGGAFGGEKETGGGRESGSDAWKGYMRRMTSTVNYSTELPLAQGIVFDIPKA